MASIDFESLLRPVSPEKPSGVNLDEVFDADFDEVRKIVSSDSAESMVDSGEENGAAKQQDWRAVRDRCVRLLGRTKDVRVANYLTLALLKQEGLSGLRDGLKLLRGMLEQYWDSVYPELDREDNNDPTQRVNQIASLSPAGSRGDAMRFTERLREVSLCYSPRMGRRYSMRDIAVATGQLQPADPTAPKPDMSAIEATFADTDVAQLEALTAAAAEAKDHLAAIDALLTDKVGNENAPNLKTFSGALAEVHTQLKRHLDKRVGTEEPEAGDGAGTVTTTQSQPGQRHSGEISSTRDVLAALDKISRYYETNEKSSPVPLFIECARQMVYKSFLDIYDKLSPDAVQQLRTISGANAGQTG